MLFKLNLINVNFPSIIHTFQLSKINKKKSSCMFRIQLFSIKAYNNPDEPFVKIIGYELFSAGINMFFFCSFPLFSLKLSRRTKKHYDSLKMYDVHREKKFNLSLLKWPLSSSECFVPWF